MMDVDLADLLAQIVRNAEFESQEPNGGITLTMSGQCIVWGSAELLHSAIENVVRNAIRYTENGTPVEVHMACDSSSGRSSVLLLFATMARVFLSLNWRIFSSRFIA